MTGPLYIVSRNIIGVDCRCRVTGLHDVVFHGACEWGYADGSLPAPLNQSTREEMEEWFRTRRIRLVRSGRFVPDVFSSTTNDLVVSPRVRQRLEPVVRAEFRHVACVHLCNLEMPALGDLDPWDDSRFDDRPIDTTESFLRSFPHKTEFEKRLEGYTAVLAVAYHDVMHECDSSQEIAAEFANTDWEEKTIDLSVPVVSKYGVTRVFDQYVFSKRAMRAIAPYLDLDYYDIDELVGFSH